MNVHVLNGATLRPPGGGSIPTQCLLLERPDGLVLVDAGLSVAHLTDLRGISFERHFIRPPQDPDIALVNQLRHLGLDPRDVTDIVLTHLHSEHCTGIMDFPHARIHVSRQEHESAMNGSLRSRIIYRHNAWAHNPLWELHDGGEMWHGIAGVAEVLPGILMVPLRGHTAGHSGIAVQHEGGWLLHAGDATYGDPARESTPPVSPLRQYEWIGAADPRKVRATHRTLRRLATEPDITVICSHLAVTTAAHPVALTTLVDRCARKISD